MMKYCIVHIAQDEKVMKEIIFILKQVIFVIIIKFLNDMKNEKILNMIYFLGPTICYDDMETVQPIAQKSLSSKLTTDKLFEVSPSAEKEQIVEIEVTGDDKPSILIPSADLLTVSKLNLSNFTQIKLKVFLTKKHLFWSHTCQGNIKATINNEKNNYIGI